jgi:hypothetical protein
MSQGISSALAYLEDQIEATLPKTDTHHGFVAINSSGRVAPLEAHQNTNRYFELRLEAFAIDDGEAGLSGRRRARVVCRVRYDIGELHFLERLIAEDGASLLLTLKGPQYDLASTGIVSVIPGEPVYEPILDPTTEITSLVLSLPFDLLYLEALS